MVGGRGGGFDKSWHGETNIFHGDNNGESSIWSYGQGDINEKVNFRGQVSNFRVDSGRPADPCDIPAW